MNPPSTRVLHVFAPVKINLYLHVTGRRDDGYHMLDSLIGFADIGDHITIEAAQDFTFLVDGPYAQGFSVKEQDSSPHSSNLVVQAAWSLAQAAQKIPSVKARLTKNIPLASGLGGGSTDAAALAWGLMEWWGLPTTSAFVPDTLLKLGADVPVCFTCQPSRILGIGDVIEPAPEMSEIPIVIVNPGKPCPTAPTFRAYQGGFKDEQALPETLHDFETLITFLNAQSNDLQDTAIECVPEISNVLTALQGQMGCALSRLSGSGASCFGLFKNEHDAERAAKSLALENPDWWVKCGTLNRPERY